MAFRIEHELHKRRFSRNLGLGLTLAAFVTVIFGLTLVKVSREGQSEGFDHAPRAAMVPEAPK